MVKTLCSQWKGQEFNLWSANYDLVCAPAKKKKKQLYKMLILKACFYFFWVFSKLYIHSLDCMYRVTMQDTESIYSREFYVV